MAGFILDASVAAAWCFSDEQSEFSNAVLQTAAVSKEALAPRLWAYEIRNTLLTGVRRGRITKDHAEQFLRFVKSVHIQLTDPLSYDAVFALAERHSLTFYDAAYLDLAIQHQLPLASLDIALNRAAEGRLAYR